MLEELQQITEDTVRLKKELQARGKKALMQATKDLLAKYPQMRKIFWTQYTPYFNDGEPCYFRVNDVNILVQDPEKQAKYEAEKAAFMDKQATAKALSEDQRKALGIKLEEWIEPDLDSLCEEVYVSTWSTRSNEERKAKYGEMWDHITAFSKWVGHDANKDTLEAVFGDHVEVNITRDGINVREYEHD